MVKRTFLIIICIGIVIIRMFFPEINFDWISFLLILIAGMLTFNSDVKGYAERIKKLKVGDLEIELNEKLKELADKTNKALEEKSEELTSKPRISGPPQSVKSEKESVIKISKLMDKPEAVLVVLAIEIEKELKLIYEKSDIKDERIPSSILKLVNLLYEKGLIDSELNDVFKEFWQLRNKVVHGHDLNITDKQRYETIEIGIKILKLLEIAKKDLNKSTTKITLAK